MPSDLESDILKTVAWFSLFETPVTVFEMWKWMIEPARAYRLEEVYAALEGDWLRERMVVTEGAWTVRRERFLDATRKFKKLRRATRYFALIPTVETVCAANTLAWWNTRPDSDIDLLVVTRPGTIWLTRLLMVTPFALLGRRPGASTVDPFCFSFFVTSDVKDLSPLRLDGGDPYLDLWIRSLVPVYNRRITTPQPLLEKEGRRMRSPLLKRGGVGGGVCERLAKRFQLRRLPTKIREMMNKDSRVVVSDSMLKFHDQDRRAEYRDRLHALCPENASQT